MYKKIFITLLALSGAATLKAQTQKGDQLLGLSGGLATGNTMIDYSSSYNYYGFGVRIKNTSYTFGPSYSYFVADNLDLGTNVGYSWTNAKYFNTTVAHELTATVYLRKYFLYHNKIGIRTGPFASYGRSKTNMVHWDLANQYEPVIDPLNSTILSAGLGVEFVCFPVKQLGLAASVGSINYTHKSSADDALAIFGSYNKFGANFFSGINISAFYAFGK